MHNAADLNGIQLTRQALSQHIGPWASIFVAVAIFLFAFSSLVGNYYYGETNIEFLNGSKVLLTAYRIAVLGMVMLGCSDNSNRLGCSRFIHGYYGCY